MIHVESVSKTIGGRAILTDVSFRVAPGITALLGPNGAGKSTLLRILSGIWHPTSGRVTIANIELHRDAVEAKRRLGYQPEFPDLHPALTPRRYLDFVASVRRCDRRATCAKFGVDEFLDVAIGKLSQGQKRLVTLVAAVMHDPEVLLLDEPTNSLDPQRVEILRTMLTEERRGKTHLISTHQLDFIGAIADVTLTLSGGRLVT
ncbi:MAG TPA: ABC transporter ATP-binding protein [Thermoanaerobaculia bacterium]|nr:ABC transporter ATP-binding protein [Thermoanaerobaculia bacterium]